MNGLLNPFILSSGGFVPSVPPTFWHRAYSLSLGNNDPVVTWPDSSGNGWDMTAAGGDVLFNTNAYNGKPAVQFQNAQGGYLVNAGLGGDLSSRMVILVFQETPHLNNAGVLVIPPTSGDDFNNNEAVLYTTDVSNNGFGIYGGAGTGYFVSGLAAGTNALHIWSEVFEFDGGSGDFVGSVFLDGVLQTTDAYNNFTIFQNGIAYGVRYTGGFNTSLVPDMRLVEGVGYVDLGSPGLAVHSEWIAYLKDFYAIP